MFGFVTASFKELSKEENRRYSAVYCGICRAMGDIGGQTARLGLSYDMAFLALLLTSLYEPEEEGGSARCGLHPLKKHPWADSPYIRYAADMNIALAYYNCLDDWQDDHSRQAKWLSGQLEPSLPAIEARWPRQCAAIRDCIQRLSQLEAACCSNPDEPAGCFGALMAELLIYEEDLWADTLREMGMALGRFIYLADAAEDYEKDKKKDKYNPYIAADISDPAVWDAHLVLAMSRCTHYYDILPLVQDKSLLDNILYSGVWTKFTKNKKEADQR